MTNSSVTVKYSYRTDVRITKGPADGIESVFVFEKPNFLHIPSLWSKGAYEQFHDINHYQVLSQKDMDWMWSIQPEDEDIHGASLNSKINWWLSDSATTGHVARPYFNIDGEYRYGYMWFPYNRIRIVPQLVDITTISPTGKTVSGFYKVDGITPQLMSRDLGRLVDTEVVMMTPPGAPQIKARTRIREYVLKLIKLGYVQIAIEKFSNDNLSITSHGVKLHPVWKDTIWKPYPRPGDFYIYSGALR